VDFCTDVNLALAASNRRITLGVPAFVRNLLGGHPRSVKCPIREILFLAHPLKRNVTIAPRWQTPSRAAETRSNNAGWREFSTSA
jgi:hypothetical protein